MYVLIKRGMYYGPNHSGYFYRLRDAGRYTKSEAEKVCENVDTVSMMHENEAPRYSAYAHQGIINEDLEVEIKQMRAALEYINAACSDFPKPSGHNIAEGWVDLADKAITMVGYKAKSAMSNNEVQND